MGKVPTPTPPSAMLSTGFEKSCPRENPVTHVSHAQTSMTSTHRKGRSFERNSFVISDHLTLQGLELIGRLASRQDNVSLCLRLCAADAPPAWRALW